MPIYEYKCKECGKVFTKLIFNSSDTISCPSCKSTDIEKQVTTISSIGGSNSGHGSNGCGGRSGFS